MSEMPDALSPLQDQHIWVAWNNEGGRKIPKSPYGGNARSNDPTTWGTYSEASSIAARNGYSGVGVMLTDGLVGIDLDGAIGDDGKVKPWAQEIIDSMDSYAEISPSKNGAHILAYADTAQTGAIGRADHRSGIEVYNNGRYFTVTGEQLGDSAISDRTSEIIDFVASRFKGKSAEQKVRESLQNLARDQVQRRANQTMQHNAARDGLRYARVSTGAETCTFCTMFASRGFVYKSEQSAGGDGNHYHRGCRCRVVPGFDGMEIDGYDPQELSIRWRAFEEIDNSVYADGSPLTDFDKTILKTAYMSGDVDFGKVSEGMAKFSIPESKLTRYALDPDRQPDKAEAFRRALGYTKEDAAIVAAKVYEHMADNEPEHRSSGQYGESYTTIMEMTGKNGRTAKVLAGWIQDSEGGKMRLTTIHVDK